MKNKNKGHTLLLVVIISGAFLILTAALGTAMVSEAKMAVRQDKQTQAYYIARAGAEATAKWLTTMSDSQVAQLNSIGFPIRSNNNPFGGGTFDVKISKEDGKLLIESTGKVASANGTVHVQDTATMVLKIEQSAGIPSITSAIYGRKSILVENTVRGDITIASSAAGAVRYTGSHISGKVFIPPGASGNTVVVGPEWATRPDVKPAPSISIYPPPVLPAFPENLPIINNISLSGVQSATIDTGVMYENITISSNTTLVIRTQPGENVLRIKNLNIIQGHIRIIGEGTLKLYIDNSIRIKGSINLTGLKEKLIIYCANPVSFIVDNETHIKGSLYLGTAELQMLNGTKIEGDIVTAGEKVTLSGASTGPQIIYAPNAIIEMSGGAFVKGAVIGKDVKVLGGAKIELLQPSIELQFPIENNNPGSGKFKKSHWK